MTKRQIDIYDMGLAVENHFDDNPLPWSSSTPISNAKATLSAKLADIATQHAVQLTRIQGSAIDKDDKETTLEKQALALSAALGGYATATANPNLFERSNYSISTLREFKDAELLGVCYLLGNDAQAQIANLAPFGVVPATLTAFGAAMMQYGNVIKSPSEERRKRKNATDKLAKLIPDLSQFLSTLMDNLIVALQNTEPEFVGVYRNVRNIKG